MKPRVVGTICMIVLRFNERNHLGQANDYMYDFLSWNNFTNYLRWSTEIAYHVGYLEYNPQPLKFTRSNVQISLLLKVLGNADHEIDFANFDAMVAFLRANKDLADDLQFYEVTLR